jgi:hypothetical protein
MRFLLGRPLQRQSLVVEGLSDKMSALVGVGLRLIYSFHF